MHSFGVVTTHFCSGGKSLLTSTISLDVDIAGAQGVGLDKVTAGFDLITH